MSKQSVSSARAPKNISVFLRVRPSIPREKDHTFECIKTYSRDPTLVRVQRKSASKEISKDYTFNHVFGNKSTQSEVYNKVAKSAVDACFDGQHGVLFVYGQTGSGKTYTISNDDPDNSGILQKGLRDVWHRIDTDKDNTYECSLSYVQLYNELLTDLLDDKKAAVRIQISAHGYGDVDLVAQETGLGIEKPVTNYEDTMNLLSAGMRRKEMSSTAMNQTSSRSHTIFTFRVTKSPVTRAVRVSKPDVFEEMQKPTVCLEGRLVLCDLAGSERVSKSHAEGKTLDEAMHINSSLLVLGKVVAALSDNAPHVPFRESKLTRVLQYSLLGNGNTSIMVNISPSDSNVEESLSAILFGQRAHLIKQDARRHEILDYRALYLQLMADIDAKNDTALQDALEEEKTIFEERISALDDQIKSLRLENQMLKQENAALRAQRVSATSPANAAAAAGDDNGGAASKSDGPATAIRVLGSDRAEISLDELTRNMKNSSDWLPIVEYMRCMVLARDQRIVELGEQRRKLGGMLSDEKNVSFNLVRKLQSLGLRYKSEREVYTRRINELKTELLTSKTEDAADMVTPSETPSVMLPTAVPPPSRAESESMSDQDKKEIDLMKAMESIRVLRLERTELVSRYVRQNKAIQMLSVENEKLKQYVAARNRRSS